MSRLLTLGSGVSALWVVGCTGSIGIGNTDPDGTGGSSSGGEGPGDGLGGNAGGSVAATPEPAETPLTFTCDADRAPPEIPMRRLTNAQYRNTVRDLLSFALSDRAQADTAFASLSSVLAAVPADERKRADDDPHGSYRRLDQDVQQAHVAAYYNVAGAFGAALTTTLRLPALLGSCATGANTNACVDGFIRKFAERALRRPLGNEEVTFFHGLYGDGAALDAAALSDTIAVILNHPAFLFQTEHGADAAGPTGSFKLTPHERASRLSYHFWQTMPDEALLAAARTGALATTEGYAAQVERLFADPRAAATVDGFVGEWLKLEDVRVISAANQTPLEKSFAGKFTLTSDLRQHMVDEVVELTRHLIWTADASANELLTTDLSWAKTPDLLAIYGLGTTPATPAAPLRFAADQRPGLLTRAAFLANGSPETRPIMKGVFLRKNILCDNLPAPPNDAVNAKLPGDVSRMTTRERIAMLTETPGSNCAGCHASVINPLGFATENFDALGRARTEQVFFDAAGTELGRAPVDTTSIPAVIANDETPSRGAADLMRLAADSGKPASCLARNYYRFAVGRWDDTERDGCALEQLRVAASGDGSLKDMLRAVALTDAFQTRTFE